MRTAFDSEWRRRALAGEAEAARAFAEAVLAPLGMVHCSLEGSPAHAAWATVHDVVAFLAETQRPTLLAAATAADAVRQQWPDLAGIVPGVGRFDPCPWGLGPEIHGAKSPHWMGRRNSPATYGHFGGAGTMSWVDPMAKCGLVALTDRVEAPGARRIRTPPGAAGVNDRARLDRLATGDPNLERLRVAAPGSHLVEVLAADRLDPRAVAHVRPNRRMVRERLHVSVDQLVAGRQVFRIGR